MEDNNDLSTKKYYEDTEALVDLCESVFNHMLVSINDQEIRQMQAQLIEVSKSIDKLNKLSISIPILYQISWKLGVFE